MSAWIDCPEEAIAAPGAEERPDPSAPLLSADEVQALRWVIARARGNLTQPDLRCTAAAAAVDRLAAAPAPEPFPRTTEQELRAWATEAERHHTDVGDPWRRGYLRSVSDMLLILDAAGEPDPPDPPPWRCAVCGRPGDDAEDGRCPCGSEEWIDAEGDEPDPDDMVDVGIADLVYADAEIKQRLARVEIAAEVHTEELGSLDRRLRGHLSRLDVLESAKIAHGDQIALLWEQRNKLRADVDALEKQAAAILASMEDGARQGRAAALARAETGLAVTEEVMRHGARLERLESRLQNHCDVHRRAQNSIIGRLDDYWDRFEALEKRLAAAEGREHHAAAELDRRIAGIESAARAAQTLFEANRGATRDRFEVLETRLAAYGKRRRPRR